MRFFCDGETSLLFRLDSALCLKRLRAKLPKIIPKIIQVKGLQPQLQGTQGENVKPRHAVRASTSGKHEMDDMLSFRDPMTVLCYGS